MGNSQAYSTTLASLIEDVRRLLAFYPNANESAELTDHEAGPLLRSAVVLLHTAWENYVEQLAVEGFESFIEGIGDDPQQLSRALRRRLGSLEDPWILAGDRWKVEALTLVQGQADHLNSPDVDNTEELFDLAFGLPQALQEMNMPRRRDARTVFDINQFVRDIRGEIVHKGRTPGDLNKTGVESWIRFFEDLTVRVDEKVAAHLLSVTGAPAW